MHISILSIGQFKSSIHKEVFNLYANRAGWDISLKELEVKKSLKDEELKRQEGLLLLDNVPKNSKIIVLDERGKDMSSHNFAQTLSKWQDDGFNVTFLIGGASGHPDEVRVKADLLLSFGKFTWPHLMVRAMLAEQLYRAYTIISGHPYHKQ